MEPAQYFSYLKGGENRWLHVCNVEGRDDNVGQRPVQTRVAEIPTEQRMEVLAIVLGPAHHLQLVGDLGLDLVPAKCTVTTATSLEQSPPCV